MNKLFFLKVIAGSIFVFDSIFVFAQDTLKSSNTVSNEKVFFVSGGIGSISYFHINYFSFLSDKYAPNGFAQNSFYDYTKIAFIPSITYGYELIKDKHPKLHHIFSFGAVYNKSFCKSEAKYHEDFSTGPIPRNTVGDVIDSLKITSKHLGISFGYVFQPTFKHFFFSAGIKFQFNFIHMNRDEISHATGSIHDMETGSTYYFTDYIQKSDSVHDFPFLNLPFELRIGYKVNLNGFVLQPSVYFTECVGKTSYSFYGASIIIPCRFRKPKKIE